jgi:outer membrane protein
MVVVTTAVHGMAQATEPGDIAFTVGWVAVDARSSSGPLRVSELNGVPLYLPQPGTGVSISNTQTLAVTIAYALSDHVWLQAVLGWPVDQELRGTGTLSGAGVIGKGQQLSPALLLKYSFGESTDFVQPFLAAGANYTTYRKSRVSNDAFRISTYGPFSTTQASATSSFSPVVEAGADFRINERWFVNGSIAYTPIRTTLSVQAQNTPQGNVKTSVDVKLNSVAVGVNIGYRY